GGATWRRGAGACRGGGAARERGAEACHESAARGAGPRHPAFRSPVVHGPVAQAVHRQVGGLILVRGRGLAVGLDAQARGLARVQQAGLEAAAGAEYVQRGLGVRHVLLDPKLWIARPRCRFAAMPTGETSVGPWKPERMPYTAAKLMICRRPVMPPAWVAEERT